MKDGADENAGGEQEMTSGTPLNRTRRLATKARTSKPPSSAKKRFRFISEPAGEGEMIAEMWEAKQIKKGTRGAACPRERLRGELLNQSRLLP